MGRAHVLTIKLGGSRDLDFAAREGRASSRGN